ncbi:MAG TPA: SUMF1/EgtB/PvdO family nonheme iron enzyme [Chthoniobacter sp.]|jgi:formylglycine-generating enzyme required for sulfatase activity
MNRPARSIEIFTMSALDLFVTAMGSFAILMMILFPYFRHKPDDKVLNTPGNVLFCAWPVRVKDFQQFVDDVKDPKERGEEFRSDFFVQDDVWKKPGYVQEPDDPVVGVTWLQAEAFCQWLTRTERAKGTIGPQDEYRLPTDAEWSAAAGPGKYPWGNDWPPPPNSGNFADETWAHGMGYKSGYPDMHGYTDKHGMVAPVGSYAPNRFGLYDMAGNVSQWCQDKYRASMMPPEVLQLYPEFKLEKDTQGDDFYVMRGSNWQNHGDSLRSFLRSRAVKTYHPDTGGFRCVLVVNSQPRSAP